MAGQRLARSAQPATANERAAGSRPPVAMDARGTSAGHVSGRAVRQATGSVGRGVGGFLKPFRRVGNIVFLEVAGVFFFLFVLVFGNWAWKLREDAFHGADHQKFLVYAAMGLVFLYLSVSSFWRARRK